MTSTGAYGFTEKMMHRPLARYLRTITLKECAHTLQFGATHAPNGDEIVWCVKCGEYRTVFDGIMREWKIRCHICRYSRRFGEDKAYAELALSRHRHPAELVRVVRK